MNSKEYSKFLEKAMERKQKQDEIDEAALKNVTFKDFENFNEDPSRLWNFDYRTYSWSSQTDVLCEYKSGMGFIHKKPRDPEEPLAQNDAHKDEEVDAAPVSFLFQKIFGWKVSLSLCMFVVLL